jgi:hypothetical protein
MGIVNRLAFGVVLTVNGGPFFGDHAGSKPQPKTEEVGRNWVQVESAVRLAAVQENSNACDRNVGYRQGKQHNLPPSPIKVAMSQPLNQTIVQGSYVKARIQVIP